MATLPTFGSKTVKSLGAMTKRTLRPKKPLVPKKPPVVKTGRPSGVPGNLYGTFAGMPGGSLLNSIYSPLLNQLAAQERAAQGRAQGIYQSHSDALAAALGQTQAPLADAYARGTASTAATAEAVANRLQGRGAEEGQSLAAKLGAINAPGTTAQDVQKYYGDLSGAGFASNSADVQRMIDEGTAAQAYGAKLPGIGRLAASQQMSGYLHDVAQEFGGQRQALMEQIPQAAMSLYQDMISQKQAMDEQRSKERMALMALGDKAALKVQERKWKIQDRNFAANLSMQLKQMGIESSESLAAQKANQPDSYNLQGLSSASKYIIDPRTGQVLGPNPNYRPPTKTQKATQTASGRADLRVRRNQAIKEINMQLFNPNTRAPRENAPPTIAGLNGVINSILRSYQFDPFKKEGIAMRRSVLYRMGLRQRKDGTWYQP